MVIPDDIKVNPIKTNDRFLTQSRTQHMLSIQQINKFLSNNPSESLYTSSQVNFLLFYKLLSNY